MKHALYGRMKTGRCIKSTENINGCSANELLYFDQKCSGRHACEIFIPDPSLTLKQSCLQGWTSYLEASYVCQKGNKLIVTPPPFHLRFQSLHMFGTITCLFRY